MTTLVRLSAASDCAALMAEGVTRVEIKSGYGLERGRRGALPARRAPHRRRNGRSTCARRYLAAHALPPEFDGRADAYIDAVCAWLPALHAEGLVDAVDAFCDTHRLHAQPKRGACSTRPNVYGLPVKLHADQLRDEGGAQLAPSSARCLATISNTSSDAGVRAMARAGTVAVLLPGAYYFLRETQLPPIAALRDAGVPIAIATDHNPGSSPDAVAAADDQHGVHAVSPDTRGGAARRHRERRARARPARVAARSSAASAPTSWSGTSSIRTSSLTGSATTPAVASSSAARSASHDGADRARGVHAASRNDAAAGQRSPLRRARFPPSCARRTCRARSPSKTPTGISIDSTTSCTNSARACWCRDIRAT